MIRVVVADDQEMVRAGFRLLLERVDDIEVVAEAEDGAQAVAEVARLRPDIVLMDIRMPGLDGLAATEQVLAQTPGTRVIVLTTFDVDEYVFSALRIGASGFLLKSSPAERLVRAIRLVADGDAMLDPAVTSRVIEKFASQHVPEAASTPGLERLTERELEVLTQVAKGLSNAEVAAALFITEATVKTHVARLLAKLGLRDRVQAVVYAYAHGVATAQR
ncbi:MAG TPA: response regulator transcription factor [Pedococcus sp.]|nr:response regulator transcription factor [Pedococcus sp.]